VLICIHPDSHVHTGRQRGFQQVMGPETAVFSTLVRGNIGSSLMRAIRKPGAVPRRFTPAGNHSQVPSLRRGEILAARWARRVPQPVSPAAGKASRHMMAGRFPSFGFPSSRTGKSRRGSAGWLGRIFIGQMRKLQGDRQPQVSAAGAAFAPVRCVNSTISFAGSELPPWSACRRAW
jgi:hypothetical protein